MPTYKYRCQSCHHEFETFQSMMDNPLTTCTLSTCKGTVIKIIQQTNIQFKGSGFYINDSKTEIKSKKESKKEPKKA